MKKIILTTSLVASIIIGCGGGSGGSDNSSSSNTSATINPTQTAKTINGQFIDAPVMGLKYISGNNIIGFTDKNGKYKCIEGENITFYADEIKLGTVKCSNITTPLTLANNYTTVAKNIAYFLQNLDSDQNPSNGIIIPVTIPLSNIDFHDKNSIDKAFKSIYLTPKITPDEAYNNLINSLKNLTNLSIQQLPKNPNNLNNNTNITSTNSLEIEIPKINYQCSTSIPIFNPRLNSLTKKLYSNNVNFKVVKVEGGPYYDCQFRLLKNPPINVKSVYTKIIIPYSKNLGTKEIRKEIAEYYYPSGKVHMKVYSSIHGYTECTAYYDVSSISNKIYTPYDVYKYSNFRYYGTLKDKGDCPNWTVSDINYSSASYSTILQSIREIEIIDDNNNKSKLIIEEDVN